MSLENRLRIRPDGVVSKNDIGSRRIFTSNRLWISVEAIIPPKARENDANNTRMDCTIANVAYTPRYSSLQGREQHNVMVCMCLHARMHICVYLYCTCIHVCM